LILTAPGTASAARQAVYQLSHDARALALEVQVERANLRFYSLLADWLPAQLREVERAFVAGAPDAGQALAACGAVFAEVKELVRQRRDPVLLHALGDADALADACYGPIVDFASAGGLPLTTAWPVTRLSQFDLAIWTGFAPTSVAPIFLPPQFFESLLFWPALGHEIGHDFLVSVRGLDARLRQDLELPPETVGARPLRFQGNSLSIAELRRVFGAWFEELFSDVFGTLMFGTAYVTTMCQLFACRERPQESLLVATRPRSSYYDVHPPAHLRVFVSCTMLNLTGLAQDGDRLWGWWHALHGWESPQASLFFPMAGEWVGLPFDAFASIAQPLVERLCGGPLGGLNGMGLRDVSGLDLGPHRIAESERARRSLLAGSVPPVRDARAVISGAVLAAFERPESHQQILKLARAAIPARGTGEQRPDAFHPYPKSKRTGGLDLSPQAVVEALLLNELLDGPRRR